VMFSIMLIASYGLWRIIKQIQNQKEKILFSAFFIITHSLYLIPFLNKIYFSPWEFIESPLPVSSQLSLNEPLVYVSSITFVMIFILIYLRIKTTIPVEKKQTGRAWELLSNLATIPKKLFSQSSSRSYLIPIILLVCSFVIYSYNLEGEKIFIDEYLYLAWGGNFFGMVAKFGKSSQALPVCFFSTEIVVLIRR